MKVRKGFVSNSSSSSFVIGTDDEKIVNVLKILLDAKTLEEWWYDGLEPSDQEKEFVEESKKEANKHGLKGKYILKVSVPYDAMDMFEKVKQNEYFDYYWED